MNTDLPKDSPEGSSGETPEETPEGTPEETLELPFPELQESQAGGPEDRSQGERQKETQDQSQDQFEGHPQVPVASIASADPAGEDALSRTLGTLKDAAQIVHPGVGAKPYQWWEEMNEMYFGRQMRPVGIQFGLTEFGREAGSWRGREGMITLHRSLVGPAGDPWTEAEKLGERYARDVLLHQMVHQYVWEVRQISGQEARLNSPQGGNGADGGSPHNCPSWVAEINRLMEKMDLGRRACLIKQRRIEGDVRWAPPEGFPPSGCEGLTEIGQLARWPHSARPVGYYINDPNPAFELKARSDVRDQM